MRALNIAAFAVSGYASTEGRQCKPFNPLLGETYEADYPDKGLRFFSEKVVIFYSQQILVYHITSYLPDNLCFGFQLAFFMMNINK